MVHGPVHPSHHLQQIAYHSVQLLLWHLLPPEQAVADVPGRRRHHGQRLAEFVRHPGRHLPQGHQPGRLQDLHLQLAGLQRVRQLSGRLIQKHVFLRLAQRHAAGQPQLPPRLPAPRKRPFVVPVPSGAPERPRSAVQLDYNTSRARGRQRRHHRLPGRLDGLIRRPGLSQRLSQPVEIAEIPQLRIQPGPLRLCPLPLGNLVS